MQLVAIPLFFEDFIVFHGISWICMDFRGRGSAAFANGTLPLKKPSLDSCWLLFLEIAWISMRFHGFPWISRLGGCRPLQTNTAPKDTFARFQLVAIIDSSIHPSMLAAGLEVKPRTVLKWGLRPAPKEAFAPSWLLFQIRISWAIMDCTDLRAPRSSTELS